MWFVLFGFHHYVTQCNASSLQDLCKLSATCVSCMPCVACIFLNVRILLSLALHCNVLRFSCDMCVVLHNGGNQALVGFVFACLCSTHKMKAGSTEKELV